MFLLSKTTVFRWRISSNTYSLPNFYKIERWKSLIFLTKTLDSSIFFLLFKSDVLLSRKTFFYGEYRQLHFPGLFGIKYLKKNEKNSIFWPKPWTNPFGKMQVFNFLKSTFFLSRLQDFLYQGYRQTNFSCPPLEKCYFFDLLKSMYSFNYLDRLFFLENVVKHIFLAYFLPKRN